MPKKTIYENVYALLQLGYSAQQISEELWLDVDIVYQIKEDILDSIQEECEAF